MSAGSAPAWYASDWPSPVSSQLLLGILYALPDAAGREHDRLGFEVRTARARDRSQTRRTTRSPSLRSRMTYFHVTSMP